MNKLVKNLHSRKYEILLGALTLHLFMGIFLNNVDLYVRFIWPINVLVLGIASVGVFAEQKHWRKRVKNGLWILIVVLPFMRLYFEHINSFMIAFSFTYAAFFILIFYEVFKFLIRPSYVNTDLLSAAACGYFLLLEIAVFTLQAMYYILPYSFYNLDARNPVTIFMDLVYFSSISATSIGFGDITPATHHVKLFISLFGVICQFYMVVLIGLLISKFTSNPAKKLK